MNLKAGESGASGFFYYGYPDLEEMMFLRKHLNPGDLFVDIGANSGGWSLTCCGLGANVIAVEPVGSSFKRLNDNFSLNSKNGKLRAFQLGISKAEGELLFTTNADTGNKVVEGTAGEDVEKVRVTTLDHLLKDSEPKIIKIDVEGHELPVILGAENTLRKKELCALILETFRWANYNTDSLKEIENILASNNFVPVSYDPKKDSLVRLKDGEGGQNTIYVNTRYFNPVQAN